MNGAFEKLQMLNKIKQRQVFCPTAKVRVLMTPLTVGDDLSLKTMVVSPDLYDRELAQLLYSHCKFPDIEKRPEFQNFVEAFSDFDKKSLLWGLIAATYGSLGKQDITCPKCQHKFEDTIHADDLIHQDFAKLWDKEEPFDKYVFDIDIEINDKDTNFKSISFTTSIPSIKQHFDVLQLISPEKMKENYEKFGLILTKPEELALITRKINIKDFDEKIDTIEQFYDIHKAVKECISIDIVKKVVDQYNKHFGEYEPKFRKPYACSNCGKEFDFTVDTEMALFRNFLGL